MRVWDDVNARARGLASHLLGRRRLEQLAAAETIPEIGDALERAGYPTEGRPRTGSAAELERAVRLQSQARLSLLARWCGDRVRFLAVVFEDVDRRSLRALVRAAVAGVSYEERLSGLVPTPSLPERALQELARLESVSQIAATLSAWRNPYGSALRPEADRSRPDLFSAALAVNRVFAARALEGARRAGRELRAFAEETVDVENAAAALVLSSNASDAEAETCFLEGGRRLDRDTFVAAARDPRPLSVLEPAFFGTPLARALAADANEVELAAFRARLEALVYRARLEPLSPLPLLAFVFRLRAEALDLRRIIWARALGATAGGPEANLVST